MSFDPKDFNDVSDALSYGQRRQQLEKQEEIANLLRQQEAEKKRERTLPKCPACATRIEKNVSICKSCRKELIWIKVHSTSKFGNAGTHSRVILKERAATDLAKAIESSVTVYNSKHTEFFSQLQQSNLVNRLNALTANVDKNFESFPQAIKVWKNFQHEKNKTQHRLDKLKKERDSYIENGCLMAGGGLVGFFLIMCCGAVIKPETSGGIFMLLFCLIAFPLTGFFSGRIFAKLSLEPEIDELKRSLQSAGTPKEFESHVAIKNDLNRLGEATKDLRRYLQTIKDLHTQASALSVSIRGTSARPFPKYTESLSGEDYGYDIAKTIEKLRLLCDSNSSKNAPNAGEGESNTTTNVSEVRTHSQPSAWPKGMILNSEKIGANSPSMQQSEQSSTFEERLIQIVKIEFLRNSGVDIDQDPLGPKVKQDILEQSESLRCQLQSKETRLVIPYAAVVDNKAIDLDVLIKPTDFPATQLEETTSSLPETSSAIYSVILMTFGEHKLGVVKLLKTRLNLSLMEAKKLVERCPVVIASGLTEDDAGDLVMEINNAGGQAEYE